MIAAMGEKDCPSPPQHGVLVRFDRVDELPEALAELGRLMLRQMEILEPGYTAHKPGDNEIAVDPTILLPKRVRSDPLGQCGYVGALMEWLK